MKRTSIVFCITLLWLSSTCQAQHTFQTCAEDPDTCSYFFDAIRDRFFERSILHTLRKAFFPTRGSSPILFDVFMRVRVEQMPNIICTSSEYPFANQPITTNIRVEDVCNTGTVVSGGDSYTCVSRQWNWQHQWSRSILNFVIEREDLEFLPDTNFISFASAFFNNFDTSVFSINRASATIENSTNSTVATTQGEGTLRFFLTIPFLPCTPSEELMRRAWEDILPWIQVYAKYSEDVQNVEYEQEDRGFAWYERSVRQRRIFTMLIVIHVLFNAIFMLAATFLAFKYHTTLYKVQGKTYQAIASMYWSVVFFSFVASLAIIAGNAYLYIAFRIFQDQSQDAFVFRLISDITALVLIIIGFLVSLFTPHNPDFFIPFLIRRILCCNVCSCCCPKGFQNVLRRLIHSIAMWIILIFLQLVISSLLPIAIVCVRNPVPSLAFISLMAAMFGCLVVFGAYFINVFEGDYIATHRRKDSRRSSLSKKIQARSKLALIANAFIFLVILCIATLVIVIYLDFVRSGADANSAGGLFFSLIPTVILSGVTWIAKRSLFKEFEEDKPADLDQEEMSLIKIGGFSIGSKHQKSFRRLTQPRKETETPSENGGDFVIDIDIADHRDTDVPNPKPKSQESRALESGAQESEGQESSTQESETQEARVQDPGAQESRALESGAQESGGQESSAQDAEDQKPESKLTLQ